MIHQQRVKSTHRGEHAGRRRVGVLVMALGLTAAAGTTAETVSATVGFVSVPLPAGKTVAVGNPFQNGADAFLAGGLSDQLGASTGNGDLLSVWTGSAFNSYPRSSGQWVIHGTTTRLPASRLETSPGSGYMLTRTLPGDAAACFSGTVLTVGTQTVAIPAGAWKLLTCPYPTALTLADLTSAGAATGDQVRVWDRAAQLWQTYTFSQDAWNGPGQPVFAVGDAFLYFNAAVGATNLTFRRPTS